MRAGCAAAVLTLGGASEPGAGQDGDSARTRQPALAEEVRVTAVDLWLTVGRSRSGRDGEAIAAAFSELALFAGGDAAIPLLRDEFLAVATALGQ